MGTLKFSLKMLKKEYKKSLIYILTLCLTIAVTFLFFNIIDNTYLMEKTTMSQQMVMDIPFSTTLSFIVIIFCAFMIIFANNFYISRKTKEIAIMTMSGSGFIDTTMYLFYQNFMMTLIAFPLGIFIGALISMFVNQCIYHYLALTIHFFYLPINAIFDTLICICAIIGAQLVYASGFVYRKDIQYMLSQEQRTEVKDNRIIQLPTFLYWFIYLFGLIILLTSPYSSTSALFPCCIGVLGIGGMLKYCLPNWLKKWKDKRYLTHPLKLISLSNLLYSLQHSILLIGIYGVSTSVMIAIMISQQDNPREMITAIVGYIVVMLLLLVSILYKYSMEAMTRKMFYYNLYKLGYSYHQLLDIIKQEVSYYYSVLVGLPFLYIIVALIQAFIHQGITLEFMITVILAQILSAFLAAIVTYISYRNSVLKVLKEGVRYE